MMDYVRRSGRGARRVPAARPPVAEAGPLRPTRTSGHSGLASPAYCHFTSPIRRYPDLVCHRALLHELGAADDPPPRRPRDAGRARVDARARGDQCRVRGGRHLPRVAARTAAVRRGLGARIRRRDHRRDPLRHLRALRRGVRGLRARRWLARRLLRADALGTALDGRRSGGRSASATRWPSGREDRTGRGQGRAGARGPGGRALKELPLFAQNSPRVHLAFTCGIP